MPDGTVYFLIHRQTVRGMVAFERVVEMVLVDQSKGVPQLKKGVASRFLLEGGKIDLTWPEYKV